MDITTQQFNRMVNEHRNRMEDGMRQRWEAGEMPHHSPCERCGLIVLTAWMAQHLAEGAIHVRERLA